MGTRSVKSVLLGILIIYLGLCAVVFFRQRSLLYFPTVQTEASMLDEARSRGFQRWINSSGKPMGWMTSDGTDDLPILVCHGNAGHPLHRGMLFPALRAAGMASRFYVLDYPGFGSRAGKPTQTSLVDAAVEGLESLGRPAILLGESLGTGVVAQAANKRPDLVQSMLLLTPFDSIRNVAAYHYPWLPSLLVLDSFDSIAALKNIQVPVAIIAAEFDATTPSAGARRLYESLQGPKKIVMMAGIDHNDAIDSLTPKQWREVSDFLKMPQPSRP